MKHVFIAHTKTHPICAFTCSSVFIGRWRLFLRLSFSLCIKVKARGWQNKGGEAGRKQSRCHLSNSALGWLLVISALAASEWTLPVPSAEQAHEQRKMRYCLKLPFSPQSSMNSPSTQVVLFFCCSCCCSFVFVLGVKLTQARVA